MSRNVYMLNIFDELEIWNKEEDYILGNCCDILITDTKDIEKYLSNKDCSPSLKVSFK